MNYSTSFERMLKSFNAQGCRISRILLVCNEFITDEFCDYITTRGEMLSYLPAGKEHKINDDGKWSREGRQEAKPAKLIRKVLKQSTIDDFGINDKEFESFANNVKAYVLSNGDGENDKNDIVNIVVCNGDLIDAYYGQNSYAPNQPESNLSGSCMRGMSYGTFELYTENHDVIHMAVALNADHMVLGRALLWKTKERGWCMDTIYAQDKIRTMFINFARKNNMHYKSQQSCHWQDFDMYDGNSVGNWTATVDLDEAYCDDYPYVDTMYYLNTEDDMIRNREWSGEHRVLRCNGGSYETNNTTLYDDWSGDDIDEDDARYVDYRLPNGERFRGNTHIDNLCDVPNYGYVLEDHAIYSSHLRQWIVDDADYWLFSERDDRWYDIDDCVTTKDGEVIDYDYSICLPNGDYAHYEECVETVSGIWELQSDCVETEEGWVLKSSINNDNQ